MNTSSALEVATSTIDRLPQKFSPAEHAVKKFPSGSVSNIYDVGNETVLEYHTKEIDWKRTEGGVMGEHDFYPLNMSPRMLFGMGVRHALLRVGFGFNNPSDASAAGGTLGMNVASDQERAATTDNGNLFRYLARTKPKQLEQNANVFFVDQGREKLLQLTEQDFEKEREKIIALLRKVLPQWEKVV